jgi:hypothetical protein
MSLSPRIAFQIGRRGGLRAADELVDQLAQQLRAARREIATLRMSWPTRVVWVRVLRWSSMPT